MFVIVKSARNGIVDPYSAILLFVYQVTAYLLPTRNHLAHRLIEVVAKSIQVARFCSLFLVVYCEMSYGTPNLVF